MTLTEKVAYIKGLMAGLSLDAEKPETKVLNAIVDALNDIAMTVSEDNDRIDYLEGYADELDDDLALLEDTVYGDEDDDDECDCDDCDYDCDECDCDCDCDDVVCVECPSCGEEVCLDDSMDFDAIKCPACGEEFSCEITEEEDDE